MYDGMIGLVHLHVATNSFKDLGFTSMQVGREVEDLYQVWFKLEGPNGNQ